MSTISGVNSAALLILQQTNSTSSVEGGQTGAVNLVAVAHGFGDKVGMSAQPGQAQSRVSEAIFSVNSGSVIKEKLALIERAGEKLGFDKNDFDSDVDFARQMRRTVLIMQASGADQRIAEIEKDLGLDKLGVSLLDVVSSAQNPDRDDALTQALVEQMRTENKDEADKAEKDKDTSVSSRLAPDDIGLYGPTNV
jgi:hypothetical protein